MCVLHAGRAIPPGATARALVIGRATDILRAGAAGAAIGGSAGAVSGAFNNDKVNPVYRPFVQRCLQEKGFDVIGWN
jgi:hypothetical protein